MNLSGKKFKSVRGLIFFIKELLGASGEAYIYSSVETTTNTKSIVRQHQFMDDREVKRVVHFFSILERVATARSDVFTHIARLLDVIKTMHGYLTVWRLYAPGDLSNLLKHKPTGLPEKTVFQILKESAKGIYFIHKCQYVHRDIKPWNIVLNTDGTVLIIDFGLTIPANAGPRPPAGTPGFMSPNILCSGEPKPSDDIFSLGVTAFYLLTGSTPFEKVEDMNAFRQRYDNCETYRRKLAGKVSGDGFELVDSMMDPGCYQQMNAQYVYEKAKQVLAQL